MDKNKARAIAQDIEVALASVAAKHGMTVTYKGGSFDSTGIFKPRMEFRSADADRQEFSRYAPMFGLSADAFGRTFVAGGISYRITGLKPSAGRRPVRALRLDNGKTYVFPAEMIKVLAPEVK